MHENTSILSENIAFSNQVSPSEPEQIIVISLPQLSDLITQAVEKAIQPLQDRVESLEATITSLDTKVSTLESTQEHDVNRICLDIAYDRQRLKKLETVEPQPLQRDRAEILRALIVANGGKMLAKDARNKMHLSKELFSMLIASMKDDIEIKPLHSDKRKLVLTLK